MNDDDNNRLQTSVYTQALSCQCINSLQPSDDYLLAYVCVCVDLCQFIADTRYILLWKCITLGADHIQDG